MVIHCTIGILSVLLATNAAGPEATSKAGTGAQHDGHVVRVSNDAVVLTLDETDGTWSGVWSGKVEAAVRRAGFSVQVDGKTLRPEGTKAETERFTDRLGAGMQIRQTWGDGPRVGVERTLRVYDALAAITISGRITNTGTRDVSLGTTRMVEVSVGNKGGWRAGSPSISPAAVFINGTSELLCEPAGDARSGPGSRSYRSTGILALAGREPATGVAFGYLTAFEARPDLAAEYRRAEGGTSLSAELRFLDRRLGPGESVDLDTVYIAAHADPYVALERYGDAAAALAQHPIRRNPNSLWCSWYAHRMAMTEDLVLANADVAARHFKPLGMDVIQLDHGWQRGDITGDWVANERFPHGLKWLSDELKSRYGFKLGVWIAPTDIAETSETFKQHPDWALKDDGGKPLVNWKWYWKPNPNCYELDASNPAASKWIQDTFARLTASGVSYYKIDFIAASGGEQFRQYDPRVTRGWSVLRRAMEAIRRGAGPEAWIRYCQTPPLLSAGLAESAYGGSDTLDAGLGGNIDVLRTNARSLAAGYWINDRLYHREVCDMSVRMQADVEETRMRLAMMTLAGCSISFSDEFQYLPPSRIRMMQQCLPPGSPPMKPIDLFERTIPSVWHVHCKNAADEWDVVGLFNFENRPEERTVSFAALGLPADAEVLVFEFWEELSLGLHRKSITLMLPPQTSRVLAIRRAAGRPQVIGTDMHLLQGYHEIARLVWDAKAGTLSGEYKRMPGLACKAFVYVPPAYKPHFDFPLTRTSARLTHIADCLWMHEVSFAGDRCAWSIPFDGPAR
jgi:hypothetical protein